MLTSFTIPQTPGSEKSVDPSFVQNVGQKRERPDHGKGRKPSETTEIAGSRQGVEVSPSRQHGPLPLRRDDCSRLSQLHLSRFRMRLSKSPLSKSCPTTLFSTVFALAGEIVVRVTILENLSSISLNSFELTYEVHASTLCQLRNCNQRCFFEHY